LANALFGDGSAALLVESLPRKGFNFKTAGFFCDIIPEDEAMTWHIGDHGFEMKLSSYVPSIIQRGIKKLMTSLLAKSCYQLADISFFAIHPGGRKILEAIEKELSISKEQDRFAYEVLRNFGNMSSPTVLFVLKEIKKSLIPQDENKLVMSFAFGPGLTLESLILKIENH
jgi:predicted naringenin-chalcone synthase